MIKKYKVIVKVGNNKFLKYSVNNLLTFTKFLDKNYYDWRWFNVFDYYSKNQLGSFTKYNRPTMKYY